MKRKSNVFYLDFEKAKKEGYFVDRIAHIKKYDIPGKQYKMVHGAPLVRNIDGFCVYEADIPLLITNVMERGIYNRMLSFGKAVFFAWKR